MTDSDGLKHIVINDEAYLVEDVVYGWHLSLSKENEQLRETLAVFANHQAWLDWDESLVTEPGDFAGRGYPWEFATAALKQKQE